MNGASRGVLHGFMSLVTWGDSETRVDGVRRRLDAVDASSPRRRSITPDARRELAIQRGLAKRLEQLAIERERRDRAAMAADEEFTTEFLNAAREVFIMAREPAPIAAFKAKPSRARETRNRDSRVVCSQIDVDESGDLEKAEIIDAVKNNQACGRRR